MSHQPDNSICPNCGFPATHNYCAQCGQETHLHKDTFGGLVMHFIGHYFHYDSKFWQTVKALLFSPGKLTTAYFNKQRMRYIPPISLYIFISAVFFLTNSLIGGGKATTDHNKTTDHTVVSVNKVVDTATITETPKPATPLRSALNKMKTNAALLDSDDARSAQMNEHFFHILPRVFFFMIPVMASLLTLLFIRRKNVYFANHIIFSLHFQSLLFTLMLVITLLPASSVDEYLTGFMILSTLVYFTISLKRVYQTGWIKAILYSIFTSFFYILFLVSAIVFVVSIL